MLSRLGSLRQRRWLLVGSGSNRRKFFRSPFSHDPKSIVPMARLRRRLNFPVSKRSTKRSITIADHKTSVSLENEYWDCLREIAVERAISLEALVAAIDANRQHANLSSAIRIFVLQFYRYQRR